MAVRLDAAVCLDLPVVCPSTCSGGPCVSGYESCQTTFAQTGMTHCMLAGWDQDCWSFLMSYVQYLFDLSFYEVCLSAFLLHVNAVTLGLKTTEHLHCIVSVSYKSASCMSLKTALGIWNLLCCQSLCRWMMPFLPLKHVTLEYLQQNTLPQKCRHSSWLLKHAWANVSSVYWCLSKGYSPVETVLTSVLIWGH